jgi:hypothetical protein
MSRKGSPAAAMKIPPRERRERKRKSCGRDIVPPAETSLSPRGGAKHRTLKKQILALLAVAGPEGRSVNDLSKELGVLKPRVQAWFSGTGKRTKEIEKMAPAHWRMKGR